MPINNITYRRVKATGQQGKENGHTNKFSCNSGGLACRGIVFEDVDLGGAECEFTNVFGKGEGSVQPQSCVPPKFPSPAHREQHHKEEEAPLSIS